MVSTKLMMAQHHPYKDPYRTHHHLSTIGIRSISDDTVRPLLRAAYAVLSQGDLSWTLPVDLFGEEGRYAITSTFGLHVFLPEEVGPYFQGRKRPRKDVIEPTFTKGNHSSPLDDRLSEDLTAELHRSPWNKRVQYLFVREIVGEAWQVGAIGDQSGMGYWRYVYIHMPRDSPMGLAQILRSHTQQ
ncbi:MAG TPA: hypothetical protein VJI15_06560 [Candidatus Nanoarchaeia archaeon]|nr:hypothetical protein [Candidatus Nanoarchaeia archaeon]